MRYTRIVDGEWIKLKVYRTFTIPKQVDQDAEGPIFINKVHKIAAYNEYFLKEEIMKVEPNLYHKNKPPAKNSCVVYYRPTNAFYKVKGSREEILDKLMNENKDKNKKVGFRYGKTNDKT